MKLWIKQLKKRGIWSIFVFSAEVYGHIMESIVQYVGNVLKVLIIIANLLIIASDIGIIAYSCCS